MSVPTLSPRALMQPSETAALLARSVETLRRWRHRGIGPAHVVVAGRIMYRADDVAQWVDSLSSSS